MNLNIDQAIALVDAIHFGLPFPGEVDVIVAPTFLCLQKIAAHLKDSYIGAAAQDLFFEDQGAFTGACSGKQIKDAGADYAIIGHSERRSIFGESNEIVNKKIKAALRNKLIPIMCIGETLAEREAGQVDAVINNQLSAGLAGLTSPQTAQLVIAYEPVWAIGTGKTAAVEQVEGVHRTIRCALAMKFGAEISEAIRLLYGGSVKPANSSELLALPNVDGALVGGASLSAPDFIEIIESANS